MGGKTQHNWKGEKLKQQFKCTARVKLKDFAQEVLPQTFIQAHTNVSSAAESRLKKTGIIERCMP